MGSVLALAGTEVDERFASYTQPLTAGMLSWLSMGRVPKYFVLPAVNVR